MKYDYVVGIDPDVDRNGVALLDVKNRMLNIKTLPFPETIEVLKKLRTDCMAANAKYIVVVEAGWLHKQHWHTKWGESKDCSAAKGDAVGRNHEVGRKILEMLRFYGIVCDEQIPLRKTWKGKDGKITHDELAYFTGYQKRNNQEGRDAALIAWNYAGLPIRVDIYGEKEKVKHISGR